MDITQTLYLAKRDEWRDWLQAHYKSEPEVWLVYYRKHSGQPRIPYSDAVEEALCFGWIDSTVKNVDEQCFAQKFSPRRPGSAYSQTNRERLRRLIAQGKVADDVLSTVTDITADDFAVPPDILQALQANQQAWQNFQRFSGPYQRIRIAYIAAARERPAQFKKRLDNFVKMTAQNRKFGFGIEQFY